MAAFEAVSKLQIKPLDERSMIDLTTARLPSRRVSMGSDEFDPRDHRTPSNPINLNCVKLLMFWTIIFLSNWMAYFNLLRSLFGAGMLGMPLAVSQAGIIVGPLIILFTGCLLIHMHLTLLRCLNDIARQLRIPHISYRYGFRMALLHGPPVLKCIGLRGPTIIAAFMLLSQLGICTVFVTFTSDNLRDIMDWETSKPALLALLLPYLILELSMKTLKIVSYVSLLGNLLNLIGLILVFYQIFKDPHGEVVEVVTEALPMLVCFGTVMFNLCAVGVVLSLDRALKQPKILTNRFGVISISLGIPTFVAIIFGCLGYWSFGTMEENILRELPFDETVSLVAVGAYLTAVALTYPIQCYPAVQIIIEVIKNRNPDQPPSNKTLTVIRWISRPLFVLVSFLVSYLVPFQAPFVAFVGNLCTSVLGLIFPALMDLGIKYPSHYGIYKVYLIKNIVIILIGITLWVFGAVLCSYLIYIRILSSKSPHEMA